MTAQPIVPNTVARPTLRSGSRTRPAATDAVSMPMKLNNAIAAAAEMAPPIDVPLTLKGPKFADFTKTRPTVAMNSSGTIFNTVNTICVTAMLRSPDRLTSAGIHRPANAITMDQPTWCSVLTNTST